MSLVQFKTNHGDFTIKLNEELAPISSANFLEYVNSGHYNGTIFHRVIPNFMVQGGGMEPGMTQKETRNEIENEAQNCHHETILENSTDNAYANQKV